MDASEPWIDVPSPGGSTVSRAGVPVKRIRADWSDVVLVCRKCSKKLDGGFGPDGSQRLAKVLSRHAALPGEGKAKPRRRRLGVLEVGCLDICPKGGVVVIRACTPGDWLVIPAGTAVETVARILGLDTSGV